MELTFINSLNESRMYRTKAAIKYVDARRVSDHAFIDLLALWVMYNDYDFAPKAMEYAAKTASFNNFKTFRQMGTDLYLNLHILDNKRVDLLGHNSKDQILLDRIKIDTPMIIQYLRQMAYNRLSSNRVLTTMQRIEQNFHIENSAYKSVRRIVQNWERTDIHQKRITITRILMFYKIHAYRSELYLPLSAMGKVNRLVDPSAKNPEVSSKAKAAAAIAAGAAGFTAGYALGKTLI